ncbi:MAG TPA: lipopolysaccharide transport periplasmic protein LptA [Methylomirabilota bacterium]|jgi:lipopolysaccharide export system protein LptA|nr:lipopolysaccharide transport periplasmic protein LptA [Methylomirabilota bacterium]
MRSTALALIVAVALGATTWPLAAQTKAPAPRSNPPAAAPKPAPPKAAEKPAEKPVGPRSNAPIVIDADRMEAFKRDGLVVFTGSVIAKQENSVQTADRMEVYLDDKGERVLRIISTGNVKIVTEDCRTGTARRAEYYDDDQRLLLIGDAKVWQEDNVVTGERIVMHLADDRSEVEAGPQGRVKSVFYPKRDEEKPEAAAAAGSKPDEKRTGACS